MGFKKLNNLFRNDANYQQVLDFLQQGTPPTNRKKLTREILGEFELHQGLIYHKPTGATVVPSDEIDDVLKEEWGDLRKSAGKGLGAFYEKVRETYIGITRARVREFLHKQPDYQLTQPFRKKTNRPILARKPNERWAIDLVDMSRFKGANQGYLYILTVVDVFSRYIWLAGLKKKESADVRDAIDKIIKGLGDKPRLLMSDNGGEFVGLLAEYCKSIGIKQIHSRSYSPESNGLVESINRRVRDMLNHIMVRYGNREWVKHLDLVCEVWNTSKHGGQAHSPDYLFLSHEGEFDKERDEARKVLEDKAERAIKKNTAEEYEKGDVVRIALAATDSRVRKDMKTGRVRNIKWHPIKWSPDLYRIVSIMRAQTVDNERFTKWRYTVKPVAEGGKTYPRKQFFANELQLVAYAGEEIPEGAEQPRKLLKKLNRLKPTEDEPREPRIPKEREATPPPPPSPPRERPQRERRQPQRYGWVETDYEPKPPHRRAKTPTPQLVPLRRSVRERKKPDRFNF
jgi:transposase InsO family protein